MQVLRRGGLKDENIVVMMADDIAHNPLNPHPGQIFNQPAGSNVYRGISKDYTGAEVNARNVLKVPCQSPCMYVLQEPSHA